MKDALGHRMKTRYEDRTRYFLPRRTYTIIRLDGKAFHTYTRSMKKPFDRDFMLVMDMTACTLCEEIDGVQFAFVQSDEISLLVTDFTRPTTEAWLDGNIQKIVSISSSIASARFNYLVYRYRKNLIKGTRPRLAYFDSRVFTIPDPIEVENYFIWRQKDWTRNSINAVAQSHYSHKQLKGKNQAEVQEMIFKKGDNWNNYPIDEKRGRIIKKQPAGGWIIDFFIPVFTRNREYLQNLIPLQWPVEDLVPYNQEVYDEENS